MVAWFPEKQTQLAWSLDAAERAAGTATLTIPGENKGAVAETWIGFVSADGQIASNSVYTGRLEV
ncbi:hypothetical protein FW778_19740 [Ginsengibacter hankyongi]|uniref:Uncharacterized protein n=1 Tax=Ginsengibacter hankyongi TaxID=2607284 RepID=A0A5J5ID86_9BACT|nr:hypothetical protein FW778_19740 [Ginsengibacter hankyongi]